MKTHAQQLQDVIWGLCLLRKREDITFTCIMENELAIEVDSDKGVQQLTYDLAQASHCEKAVQLMADFYNKEGAWFRAEQPLAAEIIKLYDPKS
jgi:hypothetical protein